MRKQGSLLDTSYGLIAQLGEHPPCKREVASSILAGSTSSDRKGIRKIMELIRRMSHSGIDYKLVLESCFGNQSYDIPL